MSVSYSDGSPLPTEYFRDKRVEDILRVTPSVTFVSGGGAVVGVDGQLSEPVATAVLGSPGIWEVVLESTPVLNDPSAVNAVHAIRLEVSPVHLLPGWGRGTG